VSGRRLDVRYHANTTAASAANPAEERSTNVDDTLKSVKVWLTFAGGVLIVAVLYWAQAVLVPFALALLLTFVLTRPSPGFNGGSAESLPCC
jgi:hypothetical protein